MASSESTDGEKSSSAQQVQANNNRVPSGMRVGESGSKQPKMITTLDINSASGKAMVSKEEIMMYEKINNTQTIGS